MAYGSSLYDRSAERSIPPRDMEASAFVFVNRLLTEANTEQDRIKALNRNHRLWSLLVTDVGLSSNKLPPILKKDLVTLGVWSMSYSNVAMATDRSLQPLIDINADMIEALRSEAEVSVATDPKPVSASQWSSLAV